MKIKELLLMIEQGKLSAEEAYHDLQSYQELGFAKVDLHRQKRKGFPEVIYGEGKTIEQLISIMKKIMEQDYALLATRVAPDAAKEVQSILPEVTYHQEARCLTWKGKKSEVITTGYIAVLCAGTTDIPVAEEAAVTAEALGSEVKRIYDVGVAGIHRLFDHLVVIQQATVVIVVAGMEGALASVVGGLISRPIIAVPTSVGYGASMNGIAALLTMLNSCASGVTVVNIDNGFGAGYSASLIHRQSKESIIE